MCPNLGEKTVSETIVCIVAFAALSGITFLAWLLESDALEELLFCWVILMMVGIVGLVKYTNNYAFLLLFLIPVILGYVAIAVGDKRTPEQRAFDEEEERLDRLAADARQDHWDGTWR